jgi:hypothetical protein
MEAIEELSAQWDENWTLPSDFRYRQVSAAARLNWTAASSFQTGVTGTGLFSGR